eukprot:PITA_34631
MQNGKAPGRDGFNVDFFKACWDIIKQDILNVVEDSRKNKIVLKALNASFIYLIPKFKSLLPNLVSEEKTGYVEGRQIVNNIIQAHKVVHSLKSNKKAAYGFDHNWIRWVMALVTTSSFSILLNGSPSKTFKPSRGLRQGDPLSPFLFILMMEGLGNAIKSTKAEGKIQGLKLTLNGGALTHQQFVDDTMLQGTPMVKGALVFKQILNDFAMAVGIEVSLNKSNIFFFNTNIAIQRNIARILGLQRDKLPSKYLGIPLTDKPLSKAV